jgi:hypothetical protein
MPVARPAPVDGSGPANGFEPASGRGWTGDDGDTDVRANYGGLPVRGSDAAGHLPRQPSGGGNQPQASEDEYLDGRVLPPNTYPPGVDDRWRDGRRQDYDAYNFGQPNWQERRDGAPSGPRPGDGYGSRLADDFEAAAGGWNLPGRTSGYSADTVRGYGRDPDGGFRWAAEDAQWPADGALWHGDGRAQWSGRAQWPGDGLAPGFGSDMGPSDPRTGDEYIPAPDGRYAPRPDVRRPEPGLPELPRPELALPELPRPEPALPELPQPGSRRPEPPQPAVRRPESARPELALPELPRPEPPQRAVRRPESPRPELALPELPRPEPALPEPSRPELALPELPQPAAPRSGYSPGQLAGVTDDLPHQPDRPVPGNESGLPGPPGPRTDAAPSSVAMPDRTTAGLGRSAEGRAERVPGQNPEAGNPANPAAGRDDDTVTAPLPAILPGATSVPRPDPAEAPRGFFEPVRSTSPSPRPVSVTGKVEPPPVDYAAPVAPRPIPPEAAAKLDQLKDLYLTAEAIGKDALDKHFDQVSQRQSELIKDFFNRSDSGGPGAS